MFLSPGSRAGRPFSRHTARQPLQTTQQTQGRSNLYAAPFDALAFNGIQVNGSMDVSQENGTTQVTLVAGTPKYVVDQWQAQYQHTAATAVFKAQQVTPPGSPAFGAQFPNCLQLTATTHTALANAADFQRIAQPIEGYRLARLGMGTAGAQSVSVGFWVYATVTGTATVTLQNFANNAYPINFAVTAPLTWQYVTATFPGLPSGTWTNTNAAAATLFFCFGAGTNFQGTNQQWSSGSSPFATAATTNFFASDNNTVCLTGVSVVPGIELPASGRSSLIMRPADEELDLCLRQYFAAKSTGTGQTLCMMSPYNTTLATGGAVFFPKVMRVAPTQTVSNSSDFSLLTPSAGGIVCTAVTANGTIVSQADVRASVASGLVVAQAWNFTFQTATAKLIYDSRM